MAAASALTGRFVWHDLLTADAAGALEFYQTLFPEWSVEAVDLGQAGTYHVIRVSGVQAGAIVSPQTDAPVLPRWIGYVAVDDCDTAAARALELGGQCPVPAVDVPGVGRVAVLKDPQGAEIKPFQMVRPAVFPETLESGQFCWNELLTTDLDAARNFYRSVFGWSALELPLEGAGSSTLFRVAERDIAGAMQMPSDEATSPAWLTYLYADDLEERSRRAESLGASTWTGPQEIPGVGRFAVHADPAGARFALFCRG